MITGLKRNKYYKLIDKSKYTLQEDGLVDNINIELYNKHFNKEFDTVYIDHVSDEDGFSSGDCTITEYEYHLFEEVLDEKGTSIDKFSYTEGMYHQGILPETGWVIGNETITDVMLDTNTKGYPLVVALSNSTTYEIGALPFPKEQSKEDVDISIKDVLEEMDTLHVKLVSLLKERGYEL